MSTKYRLDTLLQSKYPAKSRSYLQNAIRRGFVVVDDKTITKPGQLINEEATILFVDENKYVSRGGYKLEAAAAAFEVDFTNKKVLDIGASTGGFTDFSLQNGAEIVYAVDVGTNQLVPELRNHPQVVSKENLNFRAATKKDLDDAIFDIVAIDVSFISLYPIFANLKQFCHEKTEVIALIKPQFEAGLEYVGKNGVVRSRAGRLKALENAMNEGKEHGLHLHRVIKSPIKGLKQGNVEFLGYFIYAPREENSPLNFAEIVEND